MFNNYSSKSSDTSFLMLTQSLISHLSSRLLKALKNEYVDDSKFTASLMSIYKKLIDFEITRSSLSRTSETIEDLVKFCNKHLSLRSSSNDRVTLKKYQHEKISSARTPNFQRLGRIPEESPRLSRPLRKSVKKVNKKEKIHAYYESMIGQYLKMTLKSPVKTKPGQSISRSQASQVQLKDGMFFRLY